MSDDRPRCAWPGFTDPVYIAYHDTQWGVPERDHRALFEKLILDGFQAGLSWITILRKRDNFRRAFDGFAPEKIVRYTPEKIEALMQDAGIVRNRAKILGTIDGARAYLEIMKRPGGFSGFIWQFTGGEVRQNRWATMAEVPTESAESRAMAKALKAEGFRFCGPTITYAFMQAVGIVNDHLETCFRHPELGPPAARRKRP